MERFNIGNFHRSYLVVSEYKIKPQLSLDQR